MDEAIVIETAKNAATNGRWFNGLVFALLLVAAQRGDELYLWVALLPILSLGAAYLGDMTAGRFRLLTLASIVCAATPLFFILVRGF